MGDLLTSKAVFDDTSAMNFTGVRAGKGPRWKDPPVFVAVLDDTSTITSKGSRDDNKLSMEGPTDFYSSTR